MTEATERLHRRFIVVLLLLLLALFSVMISGFFGALVLAAAAALLLYPLQQRLEKHVNPTLAASLNLLFLLVAIVTPAVFLLGLAAGQAFTFAEQATGWIGDRINAASPLAGVDVPAWFPFEAEIEELRSTLASKLGQIAGAAGRFVVATLSQVTQATALFLLDVFVGAYFFFYCLQSGPQLVADVLKSLPMTKEDRQQFLSVGANVTLSVLKSLVIIGAVQGFFSGLSFYLVGVSGAIFWGVVMGFLSVIPFVGPIIIWLPVAIYFAINGEYWSAVFLAIWFWGFVASIDNVLRPRIVGSSTRMPDVLVLLTTLGGLFMFGAIGLIVGPLVGAWLMAAWEVYRRVFRIELDEGGRETETASADALGASPQGR